LTGHRTHHTPTPALIAAVPHTHIHNFSAAASSTLISFHCRAPTAKLGDILNTLLGRQAHKTELQAWFTFCDFDRSALMAEEEYVLAIELLRVREGGGHGGGGHGHIYTF
jgi:hypothetical protein